MAARESWHRSATGGSGAAPAASCRVCGSNVILNPGAESGKGTGGNAIVKVPHWTGSGDFTAAPYALSGGLISANAPGPAARGKNYFYAGPGAAVSRGTQVVPLLAGPSGIKGTVYATLSGWLGGYSVRLNVFFVGHGGRMLGELWIGPVSAPGAGGVDGLRYRVAGTTVPVGSTSADISLVMTRVPGAHNDEAADDLSLVLYTPGAGSG